MGDYFERSVHQGQPDRVRHLAAMYEDLVERLEVRCPHASPGG